MPPKLCLQNYAASSENSAASTEYFATYILPAIENLPIESCLH